MLTIPSLQCFDPPLGFEVYQTWPIYQSFNASHSINSRNAILGVYNATDRNGGPKNISVERVKALLSASTPWNTTSRYRTKEAKNVDGRTSRRVFAVNESFATLLHSGRLT